MENRKHSFILIFLLAIAFFGLWNCSGSGSDDTGRGESVQDNSVGSANSGNETGKTSDDSMVSAPGFSDTEAPSTPLHVMATAVGLSRVDLTWEASTDNAGGIQYRIIRDGIEIGATTNTVYTDAGLSDENKRHDYTVVAYDGAGNASAQSTCVNVTTKTTGRGIWFWKGSSNNPEWGTLQVIGNHNKEDAVITDFKMNKIRRVYGSYGSRPVTEPAVIAAWNAKLHAAGMESQALLGNVVRSTVDSVLLSQTARNHLLEDISDIIEFNNHPDRLDAEKFKAVHLDIEPQVLYVEWDNGSPQSKRDLLIRLEILFTDIRARLDAADPGMKLYADLGHYFEKLPPELGGTGRVGWLSQADRDQWLYNLSLVLDNVSIMAYGTNNINHLDSRTSTESVFFAEAEIGLNVKEIEPVATAYGFSTRVWTDLNGFNQTLEQVEETQGLMGNITAIHSYRYLKSLLQN